MTTDTARRQLYKARHEFRRVLDRPGAEYRHNGQTYVLDRFEPWINRWGYEVILAVWRAPCLECGDDFETALRWGDPPATRRCLKHRRVTQRPANGVAVETLPAPSMPVALIPTPTAPDPSAALYEHLELLAGVMLDLGAAIESMTAAANASRHESRKTNEKLDLLLRSQVETRRQLGQTNLHIAPKHTRRQPLGSER